MQKSYLTEFMQKANFNQDLYNVTLKTYDNLVKNGHINGLLAIVEDYQNGLDFFKCADCVKKIAEQSGISEHYVYTVYFAFLAEVLRKRYIQKGYDLDLWQQFAYDLNYQALYFYNKAGVYGQEGPLWQSRFFNYTIFGFGPLQFEIRKFGDHYKNGNLEITPDTPVVFVHIPNTGRPLDYPLVCEAYRKAEAFFVDNYLTELGGKVIFTFRSWVASKCFADILKPTSNVRLLMQDYYMFKYGEYADNDAETIERIYGGKNAGVDYALLPEKTSLQKGVKQLLLRGEHVGWGWGIYKPHVDRYK